MYLFLDIDGVFIKEDRIGQEVSLSELNEEIPSLDSCCVDCFAKIVEKYDQVKIVISSSWREIYDISVIKSRFPDVIGKRIEGVTPILSKPIKFFRYQEVLDYLRAIHAVDKFWIAIDDIAEHYPPHVAIVVTNPYEGFDNAAALKLDSLLQEAVLYEEKFSASN
jgi:hypothetical protein